MESCKTCKHWNQPNLKYPWGDCYRLPSGETMVAITVVGDDGMFQGAEINVETYSGFYCNQWEAKDGDPPRN